MMTTRVESVSSLNRRIPLSLDSHGHDAFCSSARTSLKKFFVFVIMGPRKNRGENAERPTPNAQCRIGRKGLVQSFDIRCWTFSVRRLLLLKKPGQEGLEPPTDGFGDRYSTN